MAEKSCTVRTRKFMTNRLLARRQFVRCFVMVVFGAVEVDVSYICDDFFVDY